MKRRSILVVGAGIAGLASSHWLARDGHRVVAIDRAQRFGPQGHFIALKGTGVEVLAALGLKPALQAQLAPMFGAEFRTPDGRCIGYQAFEEADAALGGYMMTRRAALHAVLEQALPQGVELRLGRTVTRLLQGDDGVLASFDDATTERFDAVLGCDGVHSATRRALFPEATLRPLGGHYIASMVEDHRHGLGTERARAYFGAGSMVNLLPVADDRLGLIVYQDLAHRAPPMGAPIATWREYLLREYADHDDAVKGVLGGLAERSDVYADEILMVPAQRVSSGRIALVGDAGYCPTFFSGMGAALALQGAYCVARCLAQHDDPVQALARYQDRILPIARRYQSGAASMREVILSRAWGWRLLRTVLLRAVPQPLRNHAARRFYKTEIRMAQLAA
ncbi:MAG: NAD(P)/FAD-dependent oxidoreductase [Sinimarinibacterium sp.]|jgi:2-polyprenyl-6-methoxyphenol hydroxylase-like FAD-dependent oxidoreductase